MARTEYIGARYVPLFANPIEWNSSRTYEPLTIVTHEGNSFTSKQYVPVGIDIGNEDFWIETGNWNAQVESYRELARNAAIAFDTTESMQAYTEFESGMIAHTNGFHASGDGGAAWYAISDAGTPNGMDVLECQNGLVAHLVITDTYVTPEMFGSYGDGEHDDTDAVNKAISIASEIVINKEYKITDTILGHSDIKISGNGMLYLSQINHYLLYFQNNENVFIDGIKLKGPGSASQEIEATAYNNQLICMADCDNFTISNCELFDSAMGGIFCIRSQNGIIDSNYCHDNDNQAAYDICFGYASNTNVNNGKIINNTCLSENRMGILVQGSGKNILIDGNIVSNKKGYGIAVYRYDNSWDDVNVSNNIVDNISYNPDSGYYDGMGIYIQAVNKVICCNNVVTNTLKDRPDKNSPNRTLKPAAISIANTRDCICSNNYVYNSGIDGIYIDTIPLNSSDIEKGAVVNSNMVINSYRAGIRFYSIYNILIDNNIVVNDIASLDGCIIDILTENGHANSNAIISNNVMKNSIAAIRIETNSASVTDKLQTLNIIDNTIEEITGSVITAKRCDNILISRNNFNTQSITHTAWFIDCEIFEVANISDNIAHSSTNLISKGFFLNGTTASLHDNIVQGITGSTINVGNVTNIVKHDNIINGSAVD